MVKKKSTILKSFIYYICLIQITLLISSCESPRNPIAPLSRNEVVSMQSNNTIANYNDVKINIKEIDEEWSIALEENLTTGYQWEISFEGNGQIDIINNEFITPNVPEGFVGAPGSHVWTFKAAKKGTVIMTLKYLRPWDKTDVQEIKTYVFNIV